MPHTRRKKPAPNKRLQVTDDSGWTHVTTTQRARRVHRPNTKPDQDNEVEEGLEPLVPAEAPPKTTLSDLQRQLGLYRGRWEASATWECVSKGLKRGSPSLFERGNKDNIEVEGEGEGSVSIVCVGLGSPSGFLRGGWVDRRAVSMYQLAALVSIMDYLGTPKIPAYAQDPVFNKHDTNLLSSQNISVLDHPLGFEKVTSRTLLFCPGAERRHLEILLKRDPAIVVGGPLEDIESDVVRDFVEKRESVQLQAFEDLEAAFWGMSIYFPPPADQETEAKAD
ncbi:hypothetical protein BDV18DRAFT_89276 [Aspergillus unguis]